MRCALAITALAACTHVRNDVVTPLRAVESIGVTVEPAESNVGWNIRVQNNRADAISLLWDESTFVLTDGTSAGRLLRGQTRVIHSDQIQPPSPIPPDSVLRSFCVPEEQADVLTSNRRVYDDSLLRGKIRLVFETEDGKETWVGSVRIEAKDE